MDMFMVCTIWYIIFIVLDCIFFIWIFKPKTIWNEKNLNGPPHISSPIPFENDLFSHT